jgi:hypothetical protein
MNRRKGTILIEGLKGEIFWSLFPLMVISADILCHCIKTSKMKNIYIFPSVPPRKLLSISPSFFLSKYLSVFSSTSSSIPCTVLLSFSLSHPLSPNLYFSLYTFFYPSTHLSIPPSIPLLISLSLSIPVLAKKTTVQFC